MRISPGNAQDIGARTDQQDAFGFSDPGRSAFVSHGGVAAVVADGMGGLAHGAKASKTAVHAFLLAYEAKTPSESIQDALDRSLLAANRAVCSLAAGADTKSGVGTTLAAAVIHEGHLYWISIGDSRVYLCHQGRVVRLTRDHVFGSELDEKFIKGRITRAEALNHPGREDLTSYLGLPEIPLVDRNTKPVPVDPSDSVVVCTDGLYRSLSEEEIAASQQRDPHRSCEILVQRALAKRQAHQDNITVVALKQTASGAVVPSARRALALALAGLVAVSAAGAAWWFLPPKISFSTDRASIRRGETAKLSWSASKGSHVTIEPAPSACAVPFVAANCEVKPEETTTYKLTASRLGRTASAEQTVAVEKLTRKPEARREKQETGSDEVKGEKEKAKKTAAKGDVRPVQPPEISKFAADKTAIKPGEEVSLQWSVTGDVKMVTLNGGAVGKTAEHLKFHPLASTAYTLVATGASGSVEKTVNVEVSTAPEAKVTPHAQPRATAGTTPATNTITQTVPPPATPMPAAPVTSTVPAAPAKGVSPETIPGKTVGRVWEVRLRVKGPRGGWTETEPALLESVMGPVAAVSLTVDSHKIHQGEDVTLRWDVLGADQKIVSTDRAVTRKKTLRPMENTEYMLVADEKGGGGKVPSRSEKIQVEKALPSPEILEFNPDKWSVVSGTKVKLKWDVKDTTKIELRIAPEQAAEMRVPFDPTSKGCEDYPTKPTTYRLVAQGRGSATDTRSVPVNVTPDPPPRQKRRRIDPRGWGGPSAGTCRMKVPGLKKSSGSYQR